MSEITQILTFLLGDEEYCLPIDYVAEIVGSEEIRPVPNSEAHVEGVTDLRGETTTILNPSKLLSVQTEGLVTDGGEAKNRIIVLDTNTLNEESSTGWLVSQVQEVRKVDESDIDDGSSGESEFIRGFLKESNEENFTLWLDTHKLIAH
jgi:purine-binding chemotaxis protein CheW